MPRPTRDTLLSISAIGPAANPSGDIVKCESTLSPAARRGDPWVRDCAVARRECGKPPGSRLLARPRGRHSGVLQVLLVSLAVLTVELSWTVINTVFTLRDADQAVGSGDAGNAFGDGAGAEKPTYRDFAYVAFDRHVVPGVRHHEPCSPTLCCRTCLAWR